MSLIYFWIIVMLLDREKLNLIFFFKFRLTLFEIWYFKVKRLLKMFKNLSKIRYKISFIKGNISPVREIFYNLVNIFSKVNFSKTQQ